MIFNFEADRIGSYRLYSRPQELFQARASSAISPAPQRAPKRYSYGSRCRQAAKRDGPSCGWVETGSTLRCRQLSILLPPSEQSGPAPNLIIAASDQRVYAAVPAAAVTMTDATATVAVKVRPIAPHRLHERVRVRHRDRLGAGGWQSGRRGHTGCANEDRSKNVTHLVTPSLALSFTRMLSTVFRPRGGIV